jgi:hypothetical protein
VGLVVSAVVVLAVSPARLRLLPPLLLAAAVAALAFTQLTQAYHDFGEPRFDGEFRHAGVAVLVSAAAAAVLGLVYAAADRRLEVGARGRRVAGVVAAGAGALAAVIAVVAFLVAVPHPGRFAQERWHSFKHPYYGPPTSSHFLSLGSSRYDFWRVAVDQFDHHPIAGIGGGGFQAAYLQLRRSNETPARAHSVELDLLSEQGIVGLGLFAVAVGSLLLLAARGTRRRTLSATAALGAASGSLAHATVDWTWTFPAVVIPVFLLLGIAGAGRPDPSRSGRLTQRAAGVAALLVALLVLAPPWLSAKLTSHAFSAGSAAADDLRWARRLDPLSTGPYLAQAALAPRPADALAPLRRAVEKEPRSSGLRYELGLAYLRAGRRAAARRELRAALALDPRDDLIVRTLRRAG